MNPSIINPKRVMEWAIQLTAQPDYNTLTFAFLDMLEQLPEVQQVIAYEIYGSDRNRSGAVCEQLIRRFPLDLSDNEQEQDVALLKEINNTESVSPSMPDEDGVFKRVVISIRDLAGPNRALVLKGHFEPISLVLLSDLASIYRNQVSLHDCMERDPLTKLPNRQSFYKRLMQVCEYYLQHPIESMELDRSSWIAVLDIDHFKRINDTYGHLYGDEVLLIFSQLLEKHFRYNDFLFRFGGEEFVVILNLLNMEGALASFNRFRETVAQHVFGAVGTVTVSIGVAHIARNTMPVSLLERADKALYYAKDHGRNQVRMFEQVEEFQVEEEAGDIDLF
jgi:diguanylate cyclase